MTKIVYDTKFKNFVDEDSGFWASSKSELLAMIKTDRLDLPVHDFLSNRFINEKIGGGL